MRTAAFLLVLVPAVAVAAPAPPEYPARPIRLIVPSAPGADPT